MKIFYSCQLINSNDQSFIEINDELNVSILINKNCKNLEEVNEELLKMNTGASVSRYDNNTEILILNPELFFNFFLLATIKDDRDSTHIKEVLMNLKNLKTEYIKLINNFGKATSII